MHLEFLGSPKHQGQEFHKKKKQGNGERLQISPVGLNDDAPSTPTNRCGYRQSDPCDYPSEKTERDQAVSSQGRVVDLYHGNTHVNPSFLGFTTHW